MGSRRLITCRHISDIRNNWHPCGMIDNMYILTFADCDALQLVKTRSNEQVSLELQLRPLKLVETTLKMSCREPYDCDAINLSNP